MSAQETFGQYMRRMREGNCLDQRTVAQAAGITPQYLWDLEHDRRLPPAEPQVVSRWAEAISADWGRAAGLALVGRAGAWSGIVRDLLDIAADFYWLPRDEQEEFTWTD